MDHNYATHVRSKTEAIMKKDLDELVKTKMVSHNQLIRGQSRQLHDIVRQREQKMTTLSSDLIG